MILMQDAPETMVWNQGLVCWINEFELRPENSGSHSRKGPSKDKGSEACLPPSSSFSTCS